jgi:ABC-type molybdate transport system substrate-binding protein
VKLITRHHLVVLFALFALTVLTACGGDSSGPGGERNAPSAIAVLADSSLKSAFTQLGKKFESQNPGTTVTFTFGPSATLASKAVGGGPGDLLTTNDQQTMNSAQKVQLNAPKTFATKGSATYQIATLTQAKNASLSQEFINLVAGPSGQQVLQQAGFGRP